MNFNLRIIFIRCHALDFSSDKCSCHEHSPFKVMPKCLCELTSAIGCWFMVISGWRGLLCFLDRRRDSVLEGLKVTSHFVADW